MRAVHHFMLLTEEILPIAEIQEQAAAELEQQTTQAVEKLQEIAQTEEIDMNAIQQFFHDLPDNAMRLGIKTVLSLILVFFAWQAIHFICKVIRHSMDRAHADPTTTQFIVRFVRTSLQIAVLLAVLVAFGLDTATVVALLGTAGIAIGLAVQGALSNFAGGLMILLVRPFSIGDYIVEDFTGHEGIVTEISLINTTLRTLDNRLVILPNGKLTDTGLTNATAQSERMLEIKVGVSYAADIDQTREVLTAAAQASPYTIAEKDIHVYVDELADSAVVMGVWVWVETAAYRMAKWDMNERVKKALDAAGIEIPFPQRVVHLAGRETMV